MSGSTFGTLFQVSNFGESHGPAIGCVIDGCPPGMALSEADIQPDLDRRKPGTSRHVTQRREDDLVEILSRVHDPRGGGRSSARLTAPAVAAGAVAKKWLREKYGVEVRGYLSQLGPNVI